MIIANKKVIDFKELPPIDRGTCCFVLSTDRDLKRFQSAKFMLEIDVLQLKCCYLLHNINKIGFQIASIL